MYICESLPNMYIFGSNIQVYNIFFLKTEIYFKLNVNFSLACIQNIYNFDIDMLIILSKQSVNVISYSKAIGSIGMHKSCPYFPFYLAYFNSIDINIYEKVPLC